MEYQLIGKPNENDAYRVLLRLHGVRIPLIAGVMLVLCGVVSLFADAYTDGIAPRWVGICGICGAMCAVLFLVLRESADRASIRLSGNGTLTHRLSLQDKELLYTCSNHEQVLVRKSYFYSQVHSVFVTSEWMYVSMTDGTQMLLRADNLTEQARDFFEVRLKQAKLPSKKQY